MDAIKRTTNFKERIGITHLCSENRRGVLLLVVLSMLTLFLLLGAAYIAVARRARMTSRAFANNITATAAAGVTERKLVDDAFLAVVRGTTSTSAEAALQQGDDLLGDKYGYSEFDQNSDTQQQNASQKGRVRVVSKVFNDSEALINLTVDGLTANGVDPSPAFASDLNGRVLTFLMPSLNVSTRILRATGTTPGFATIVVAAGPTLSGKPLTFDLLEKAKDKDDARAGNRKNHTNIIINGREFAGQSGVHKNESYDAADQNNPLLASVFYEDKNKDGRFDDDETDLTNAFIYGANPDSSGPNPNLTVDSDGDGEKDAHFIDVGLPPIISSTGKKVYPRAAVFVVDMDGRLNANIHGTDAGMEAIQQEEGLNPLLTVDSGGQEVEFEKIPRGSGVGPAEISLERSQIFDESPANKTAAEARNYLTEDSAQVKGGRLALRDSTSNREVPQIGSVFGRYGGTWDNMKDDDEAIEYGDYLTTKRDGKELSKTAASALAKPGIKNVNDVIAHASDYWRGQISEDAPYEALDYFTSPGRYGSPADWKGGLRVWVDPSTGEPAYYKPQWDGYEPGNSNDKKQTRTLNPLIDDPYEVNLTPSGPRGVPADGTAVDNLFSAAELEGLLRYYDSDSMKLSRRLVALCGNNAPRNRLLVTTESWDTPAITGSTWQKVIGDPFGAYLSDPANQQNNVFSPETVQGLQFDLNRPFHDKSSGKADAYTEPNDSDGFDGGLERRQEYAKNLFCLLVSIVRYETHAADNAFNLQSDDLDEQTTRELAQFAVNVVDFRDADSIMTPFDFMCPKESSDDGEEKVEGFKPDNSSWEPNARVWGCERPELLITETHAWHDRRTDDLSVENSVVEPTDPADNDFDQSRRPFGAFFVELMAPQASQAKEYSDGAVGDKDAPQGGKARAEPIPAELVADTSTRFDTESTIDIAKQAPGGAPVWRLASVRGDVYGGTAFDDTDNDGAATMKIRDPAADEGEAIVDRVFYFAEPPDELEKPEYDDDVEATDKKDGQPGGIFWASTTPSRQPTRTEYVVVGTDGPQFDYRKVPLHSGDPGYSEAESGGTDLCCIDQVHLRFDYPQDPDEPEQITPATLSEPIHAVQDSEDDPSKDDPYNVIAQALNSRKYEFTGTRDDGSVDERRYTDTYQLDSAHDMPFDAYTSYPPALSEPFLTKDKINGHNQPLLMLNGTHTNFAVVHLQRLANPKAEYDSDENPYVTVDSMTVDLTVVNTDIGRQNVYDESGRTGSALQPEITWLQENQRKYRFESVERGGKAPSSGSDQVEVQDIWNRRVRSDVNDLEFDEEDEDTWASQEAYRSKEFSDPKRASEQVLQAVSVGPLVSTLRVTDSDTSRPVNFVDGKPYPWLAFYNRPFVSAVELSLVPTVSAMDLGARHTTDSLDSEDDSNASQNVDAEDNKTKPAFYHLPDFFESDNPDDAGQDAGSQVSDSNEEDSTWKKLVGTHNLFGFVHTPSPFVGMRRSVPRERNGEQQALYKAGWHFFPIEQLSEFREPGRVNINTMPAANIWRAVQGDVILAESADEKIADDPDVSLVTAANNALDWPEDANTDEDGNQPFEDRFSVLTNIGVDTFDEPYRDSKLNAAFRIQTMSRLQNSVTVRSNVYAIWVTVGYFELGKDANNNNIYTEVTPRKRNRGFYLFDRSIPVAYERGKDHNVQDAVLLRRIIQ